MRINALGGALIAAVLLLVAALSPKSVAQTNDANISKPKSAAPAANTPNTNTAVPKHRYWRFRGGKHPHYGSRRVRT
ncbi:hypothetical protein [Bradyrhizobium sp. STM 3562]|uniref:hypothetical protein n=1 Tax=Bradyrhizobium sp. STM 3562 TaxID=578924 RepID=UPI00388F46B2